MNLNFFLNIYPIDTNIIRELNIETNVKTTLDLENELVNKKLDKVYMIKYLENLKRYYSKQYEIGESKISDKEYDVILDTLRKLDPNSKELQNVGSNIHVSDKVKLPYTMGSLTELKYNDNSLNRWIKKHPENTIYIITQKLDGISILLEYKRLIFDEGFTRGNGYEGRNVTHHLKHIVPYILNSNPELETISPYLSVRGELVMEESTFKEKYLKSGFQTSRNMIAGILNRDEINEEILKDIKFIPYEIKFPVLEKLSQLVLLSELGFEPINRLTTTKDALTPNFLRDLFQELKKTSDINIDGIVIDINSKNMREELGFEGSTLNPKYTKSFKMRSSEDENIAIVEDVLWEVSKNGFVIPRVLFDPPINIKNVKVSYASGKNAKLISSMGIGKVSKVILVRSGDTIPDIIEIIEKAKVELPINCPSCNEKLVWNQTKVHLVCNNDNCSVKNIKKITHFFDSIDTFGLSQKRIESFIKNGFDSIDSILRLRKEDIEKIEGMGSKSAENILFSLKNACNKVQFHDLLYATGFFGLVLGSTKLKNLVSYLGIDEILNYSGDKELEIKNKCNNLKGFSEETIDDFVYGLKLFTYWFEYNKEFFEFNPNFKNEKEDEMEIISNKLKNYIICFTGFRSKELEEQIIQNGGILEKSFTNRVNLLICKDKTSNSSKIKKAIDSNIKVMDEIEFMKLLD